MTIRAILALIATITLLTACGGGGGGGSSSDTRPNAINLGEETDAALSTQFTDTVTITGIDASTSISITGGEYSLDGGTTYTSANGTVTNNQEVTVRATSAATVSTDVDVVLTVGGVSGTFTITTAGDTAAPTAEVIFPTASTATEGSTLTIRGIAEDDFSEIQSVTLTVSNDTDGVTDIVNATSLNASNFEEWSGQVALEADTLNLITIAIEDTEGNVNTSVDSVQVTTLNGFDGFPDVANTFALFEAGGIAIDETNNRLLVTDKDKVFSVSLDTGERTVLIEQGEVDSELKSVHVNSESGDIYISAFEAVGNRGIFSTGSDGSNITQLVGSPFDFSSPLGLKINPFDGLLYIAESTGGVISMSLEDNSTLTEANRDENYSFSEISGLDFIGVDTILVADFGEPSLWFVEMAEGTTDGIADIGDFTELLGGGDVVSPMDVEYDADDARAVFVDAGLDAVLAVPVAGGGMQTISDATTPNSFNVLFDPDGIVVIDVSNIAYVTSGTVSSIVQDVIIVDLVTGERVILSRAIAA